MLGVAAALLAEGSSRQQRRRRQRQPRQRQRRRLAAATAERSRHLVAWKVYLFIQEAIVTLIKYLIKQTKGFLNL